MVNNPADYGKKFYLRNTCVFICDSLQPYRFQAVRKCQGFFVAVDGVDGVLTLVLTRQSCLQQRFQEFVHGVDGVLSHA
jgi:hypothetical protein